MSIGSRVKWSIACVLAALSPLTLAACSSEPSTGSPTPYFGGSGGATAGSSTGGARAGSGGIAAAGTSSGGAGSGGLASGGGGFGGSSGSAGSSGGDSTAGAGGVGGAGGMGGVGGFGGFDGTGGLDQGKQTARPIGNPYAKNGYWEYLPKNYGNGFKRPLLVFWAGVGENGDGSLNALNNDGRRHGPPMLINKNQWPSDRPFVVLSPQHGTQTDRPSPDEVRDFFTFAASKYDVDPARFYLTGLSSGARGSYSYLGQYKGEQVAAAVLIAGDSSVAYNAGGCSVVNQVALWDLHGDADSEVPYGDDAAGMANFLKCPQPRKEVIFTTYPGVGHVDSWPRTYDLSAGHDIYAWMLSKTR